MATETARTDTAIRPAVDILEDEHGITLYADLPGVPADKVDVQVEEDALRIEGEVALDLPNDMKVLFAEVRSPRYARSFALSPELAADEIEARLKDGVLTVRIPKREHLRPRRIQVQSG